MQAMMLVKICNYSSIVNTAFAVLTLASLYIVDNSNGTQHTMFDDDDQSCYDFDDDLDELYELAMFLIKANPMAILNEVSLLMQWYGQGRA